MKAEKETAITMEKLKKIGKYTFSIFKSKIIAISIRLIVYGMNHSG
jgi:hypothetical protein